MRLDFKSYLDGMLVAVAEQQSGSELRSVDLSPLHAAHFPDAPQNWLSAAATALHKSGYGVDWQSTDNLWFLIDGAGLRRVAEIREEKTRRTGMGRLKAIPRSDWIAILALILSTIALFKGE